MTTIALCIRNDGCERDLTVGRLYDVMPDPAAEKAGMLRLFDDTDEDYLYPADMFWQLHVPPEVEQHAKSL